MLSSKDLRVKSDNTLFRALSMWADVDSDVRRPHLEPLARHIQFSAISSRFLTDFVRPSRYFPQVSTLVTEALFLKLASCDATTPPSRAATSTARSSVYASFSLASLQDQWPHRICSSCVIIHGYTVRMMLALCEGDGDGSSEKKDTLGLFAQLSLDAPVAPGEEWAPRQAFSACMDMEILVRQSIDEDSMSAMDHYRLLHTYPAAEFTHQEPAKGLPSVMKTPLDDIRNNPVLTCDGSIGFRIDLTLSKTGAEPKD